MSKLQTQPNVARVQVTIEMDDGTTKEITAEHPDDITFSGENGQPSVAVNPSAAHGSSDEVTRRTSKTHRIEWTTSQVESESYDEASRRGWLTGGDVRWVTQ